METLPDIGVLLSQALLVLALIFIVSKFGGELLGRIGQPPVLGELLMGVLLGNLNLAGITALEPLSANPMLNVLAQIGAVLLLFEVGIESDLFELLSVGGSALLVACAGVAAPVVLGYLASEWLLPGAGLHAHLFIGATLAATSIGITARVLKDIGKSNTQEARVILGAAIADDVIGLVILAVVTGLVTAANGRGSAISAAGTLWIVVQAVLFLAFAVLAGRFLAPRIFAAAARLEVPGVLLGLCISFCFVLSALAEVAGLAPIIGAFAAGVALEEVHYRPFLERGERNLPELLFPINTLLVPVFFVLMGMHVDLRSFGSGEVLAFTALITAAAILGKQVCGVGVLERGVDRLVVGVGMIPRGEVGLIFAG
ncbi:MAG TPA: cation:proton antiporter, partial [Bryobacteraceae bacterium]|nr:cation:proton antiporter [Bryobacteraceae bacterium]